MPEPTIESCQLIFQRVLPPPAIRLSDVVCKRLEELIGQGKLTPGEGLPPERELAKSLGVSRPSLREALSTLRSRGLIERTRKGSIVAAEHTAPGVEKALRRAMNEQSTSPRDVMELRIGIEAHAAFLSAERATTEEIQAIKHALLRLARSRSNKAAKLAELDLTFHRSIVCASHNLALLHAFDALSRITFGHTERGYQSILDSDRMKESRKRLNQTHAEIFGAIGVRDDNAAWLAAHSHLEFAKQVWSSDFGTE